MRKLLLIIACLFASIIYTNAQTDADTTRLAEGYEDVYAKPDEMPQYPGGEAAIMMYLASIPYPMEAKTNDIQGKVFVQFIVDENAKVTDASIVRGAHQILDNAAMAHIKNMPDWEAPGKVGGRPVKVLLVIPISFKLDGPAPKNKKRK